MLYTVKLLSKCNVIYGAYVTHGSVFIRIYVTGHCKETFPYNKLVNGR